MTRAGRRPFLLAAALLGLAAAAAVLAQRRRRRRPAPAPSAWCGRSRAGGPSRT
ncbi:MAG: hypothetical protein IPH09_06060 [bacterium]|nr:hypothetical protein [bacterium]